MPPVCYAPNITEHMSWPSKPSCKIMAIIKMEECDTTSTITIAKYDR